jgi:hypothetical protein
LEELIEMNKVPLRLVLFILTLVFASSGVMQASAISGSLPLVVFTATENGVDLSSSTMESSVQSLTSGPGAGDFSVVPVMTAFGPITVNDLTVASGGGFSFSNATYGSFVATGGTIFTQTSNFLNVNLTGVYDPGPGIPGVTASSAVVHLSFNQTGQSLSGSYTLATVPDATVPEPGALVLLGSGILACWRGFRWQRKV